MIRPRWMKAPSSTRWAILAFVLTFVTLWITKYPYLYLPPFQDQAVAQWAEATFLADHDFDYRRLRYEEKNFMDGGRHRSYMISAWPTLIALVMRGTSDAATAFALGHVANWTLAALLAAAMVALLLPRTGPVLSLLATAALFTTPAFVVLLETLPMEMPLLLAAAVTAIFWARRQWHAATALSLVAFFIKASGMLLTLAIIASIFSALLVHRAHSRRWRRDLAMGLAGALAALVAEVAAGIWADDPVLTLPAYDWPEIVRWSWAWRWVPDQVFLFFMAAGLTCGALVLAWRRRSRAQSPLAWLDELLERERLLVFAWILILGNIAALARYIFMVRYGTLALLFLFVVVATLLGSGRPARVWGIVAFTLTIAWGLTNQDGQAYAPISWIGRQVFERTNKFHARQCIFLERSGEYRPDWLSTIEASRVLAEKCSDSLVFADRPWMILLTMPRLGYVPFPLKAVDAEDFGNALFRFRDAVLAHQRDRRQPLPAFVYSGRALSKAPPPGDYSDVLYNDQADPPLVVYRLREFPKAMTAVELDDWYLAATWDDRWPVERAVDRLEFLAGTGRFDWIEQRAGRALAKLKPTDPGYARLAAVLADLPRLKERYREIRQRLGNSPSPLESQPIPP